MLGMVTLLMVGCVLVVVKVGKSYGNGYGSGDRSGVGVVIVRDTVSRGGDGCGWNSNGIVVVLVVKIVMAVVKIEVV